METRRRVHYKERRKFGLRECLHIVMFVASIGVIMLLSLGGI